MPAPSLDDQRLLATLERAFATHAGRDGVIDLRELQKALGLRSEYLARRVLAAFDRDGDGVIDKTSSSHGVRALVFGTDREKLRFAFRVHDHDGDGSLDRQELLRMIAISLAESDVAVRADAAARAPGRRALRGRRHEPDGRHLLRRARGGRRASGPTLLRRMTRSEAIWIAPNEDLLAWLDAAASRATRARERLERWLEPRVRAGC